MNDIDLKELHMSFSTLKIFEMQYVPPDKCLHLFPGVHSPFLVTEIAYKEWLFVIKDSFIITPVLVHPHSNFEKSC